MRFTVRKNSSIGFAVPVSVFGGIAALIFLTAPFFFAPAAAAAVIAPHEGKEIIRSAQEVEVAPGEPLEFTIGFKNIGALTWKKDGKNYISIYAYEPKTRKYRPSAFRDASWQSDIQPTRLKDPAVKPGAIGRFTFTLLAPLEEGKYHETFNVAAEDLRWVRGGQFSVDIVVRSKSKTSDGRPLAVGYRAAKLLVSDQKLSLVAGTTSSFRVAFKNTGRRIWTNSGGAPLSLKLPADNYGLFRHGSWNDNIAAKLVSNEVKPGQVAFFDFTVAAPNQAGSYNPKFLLMAGDEAVEGGQLELPIDVFRGVVDDLRASEFSASGNRGPNIRVGICYIPRFWNEANRRDLPSCTDNALSPMAQPIELSSSGAYSLMRGENGEVMRKFFGITTVSFDFDRKIYTVKNGGETFAFSEYVRFEPVDPSTAIFELRNMDNRTAWDSSVNYNRYRGTIAIRYVPSRDRLWIIEELPLEDYLRGLAETSNGSPAEYQKALVTAARTYALYIVSIGGKHQSEFHDINRTGNDQVYRGYVSELIRPNVVRAAEETRGAVVTYNGEVVVTPYFSRSDGRTRAWSEVWYGSRSWLLSKPAPYDAGRTLLGHGVGMSAADAVGRARAGVPWAEILKYYYTGTELKQLY